MAPLEKLPEKDPLAHPDTVGVADTLAEVVTVGEAEVLKVEVIVRASYHDSTAEAV